MKILKKILLLFIIFILIILAIFLYELYTAKKLYFITEKNLQIPIYTYHQIVENESQIDTDYMQTTANNFKKQITGLMKLGYTPISYQDLVAYKKGLKALPKRSFIITFDDGYTSVYEFVFPIIKDLNIPITLFVINNCIGAEGYMDWSQLQEMHNSNLVYIYSHGLNHSEYDKLGSNILLSDLEQSYIELQKNLWDDNLLKVFAYPCGFYTEDEIIELTNNNYIQNLMDGKINKSKSLDLSRLHRCYPLNDSVFVIIIKQIYKCIKY